MTYTRPIQRSCGALIHEGRILMVLHHEGGRQYRTLPGGEIEPGETPELALVRFDPSTPEEATRALL